MIGNSQDAFHFVLSILGRSLEMAFDHQLGSLAHDIDGGDNLALERISLIITRAFLVAHSLHLNQGSSALALGTISTRLTAFLAARYLPYRSYGLLLLN